MGQDGPQITGSYLCDLGEMIYEKHLWNQPLSSPLPL